MITPGPTTELIDRAAAVIVRSRQRPGTGPYHWAAALWDAGLLTTPANDRQEFHRAVGVRSVDERIADELRIAARGMRDPGDAEHLRLIASGFAEEFDDKEES